MTHLTFVFFIRLYNRGKYYLKGLEKNMKISELFSKSQRVSRRGLAAVQTKLEFRTGFVE